MTNYPKDEESSFKKMIIAFFEAIFDFPKIRQVYRGKVGKGKF